MRTLITAVVALPLLASGACGAGSGGDSGGDPSRDTSRDTSRNSSVTSESLCAATLQWDGGDYTGHGDLRRDPETVGPLGTGTVPGCDDGGAAAGPEEVDVVELAALPPERAVLVGGTVFLRDGRPFPEEIRSWFVSPDCETEGMFELTGAWLGVDTTHDPRFDGDLRPPYTIEVAVDTGPEPYVGSVLRVRATDATQPGLGPDDVKTSLWEGGEVTASVTCAGRRFVATGLTSSPG